MTNGDPSGSPFVILASSNLHGCGTLSFCFTEGFSMPEWLRNAVVDHETPDTYIILIRIIIAVLSGLMVAALYSLTVGRGRKEVRSLPTTLVLLAVLISIITVVIGTNTARAFGLVGALSIVRFRTVVDDTVDTAFVILSVTIGMAIGSGNTIMVVIAIPAVTLVVLIMSKFDSSHGLQPPLNLNIRFPVGQDPAVLLAPVFEIHTVTAVLSTVETSTKGTNLDVRYAVRLKDAKGMLAFLNDLNKIEGVQNVELKQPS
jgi:hypothetical protein